MRKIFFLLLYVLLSDAHANVFAQTRAIDSLKNELKKQDKEQTRFRFYYEAAMYYVGVSKDSAEYFGDQMIKLARNFDDNDKWSDYYHFLTLHLAQQKQYDSARRVGLEGLNYSMKTNEDRRIAFAFNNLGNIHMHLSQGDSAVIYFLKGLNYAEKAGHRLLRVNMLNNLSAAYNMIGNNTMAIRYAKESYNEAAHMKDQHQTFNSLFNWATMEVSMGRYDTALAMFTDLKSISLKNKNDYSLMDVLNNIGEIFFMKGDLNKSLEQYDTIATILKKYDAPDYDLYLYMNRGNTLTSLGKYKEAESDLLKATRIAKELDAKNELANIYLFRSVLSEKTKQYKEALTFWKMADSLKQENIRDESRKNIQNLEINYQTARKELELTQKETAIRRKNTLNTALVLGIAVLGLILFLAYRNIRHRHKNQITERMLHQQAIDDLEKQHQLEAMQSIMRGQEAERSRLARDLHDGIGGLLSGVKLGLSGIRGNVHLAEKDAHVVDNIIGQLDRSISELRRVSHNMMPEALINYGLKEALQNYCESINLSGKLHVRLQTYGLGNRMEQSVEIIIYRMVQELLNNIIKHADAKNVLVQLTCEKEQFSLTVEDDGIGFDPRQVNDLKSAGLTNIKARASYLNGKVDIQSAKGEGTSVMINGKLPKN